MNTEQRHVNPDPNEANFMAIADRIVRSSLLLFIMSLATLFCKILFVLYPNHAEIYNNWTGYGPVKQFLDVVIKHPFSVMRGAASELVSCTVIAILLACTGNKWLYRTFLLSWFLFLVGNVEHVLYNKSNINLLYAFYALEGEFIEGSIFTSSFLKTLGYMALLCVFLCGLLAASRFRSFTYLYATCVLAACIVIAGEAPRTMKWLEYSVLEENVANAFRAVFNPDGEQYPKVDSVNVEEIFTKNQVSPAAFGELQLDVRRDRNVILIFLESVSAQDISTNATPFLHGLKSDSLYFSHFIATQLQTNRGLYAGLCGDYPNLKAAGEKTDIPPARYKGSCLPQELKRSGYRNVFMQSANLDFMNKDGFARAIGYDHVYGEPFFAKAHSKTGWGVDDATLFESAANYVQELERQDSPWFLTLLTSGTHAPFNVPSSYRHRQRNSRENALHYMDSAVKHFIDRLKERGALDHTLVVITADESRSNLQNFDPLYSRLVLHWIPLFILAPEIERGRTVAGTFALPDIAVSVADYLGLENQLQVGHSLFRERDPDRWFVFANSISRDIFFFHDGQLLTCDVQSSLCEQYNTGDSLFSGNYQKESGEVFYLKSLQEIIQRNDLKPATAGE